MATDAGPPANPASPPPRRPLADASAWRSLGIVAVLALFTTLNWPSLIWLWGSVLVLLFLRAGGVVLAARAASADPEEAFQKRRHEGRPTN